MTTSGATEVIKSRTKAITIIPKQSSREIGERGGQAERLEKEGEGQRDWRKKEGGGRETGERGRGR